MGHNLIGLWPLLFGTFVVVKRRHHKKSWVATSKVQVCLTEEPLALATFSLEGVKLFTISLRKHCSLLILGKSNKLIPLGQFSTFSTKHNNPNSVESKAQFQSCFQVIADDHTGRNSCRIRLHGAWNYIYVRPCTLSCICHRSTACKAPGYC